MDRHAASRVFRNTISSGLVHPSRDEPVAARRDEHWRWPVLVALLATIPAFYLELMDAHQGWAAPALYGLGAAGLAAALWHVAMATHEPRRHVARNWLDLLQIAGLLACAVLPSSVVSPVGLGLRMLVAGLTLVRMIWALQRLFSRAGVVYLIGLAAVLVALSGAGFYWLDPKVKTIEDGLWLAFTTAATVGYGDLVPSTTASRIFSVFVVLMGFGVLSLVTASIAAMFVEGEERRVEREILHELRHEMRSVRAELAALRELTAPAAQNTVTGGGGSERDRRRAPITSRPSNNSDSTSS